MFVAERRLQKITQSRGATEFAWDRAGLTPRSRGTVLRIGWRAMHRLRLIPDA